MKQESPSMNVYGTGTRTMEEYEDSVAQAAQDNIPEITKDSIKK
jgi:hypothetical protein